MGCLSTPYMRFKFRSLLPVSGLSQLVFVFFLFACFFLFFGGRGGGGGVGAGVGGVRENN